MARRKPGIRDDDEGMAVSTAAPGKAQAGPQVHELPKQTVKAQAAAQAPEKTADQAEAKPAAVGIKAQAIPTTVYLSEDDHTRLRVLVAQTKIPAQEYWQRGLDMVFAQLGMPPTARYESPRRRRRTA